MTGRLACFGVPGGWLSPRRLAFFAATSANDESIPGFPREYGFSGYSIPVWLLRVFRRFSARLEISPHVAQGAHSEALRPVQSGDIFFTAAPTAGARSKSPKQNFGDIDRISGRVGGVRVSGRSAGSGLRRSESWHASSVRFLETWFPVGPTRTRRQKVPRERSAASSSAIRSPRLWSRASLCVPFPVTASLDRRRPSDPFCGRFFSRVDVTPGVARAAIWDPLKYLE